MGCNPRAVIRQLADRVEVLENGKVVDSYSVTQKPVAGDEHSVKDGLVVVEKVMKGYRPVSVPGLPRFTGGAIGFIAYEFIHDIEPVVPRPPKDELKTPVMYFLIADEFLIFDHEVNNQLSLIVAALELVRFRPEMRDRMLNTLSEQPPKIIAEIAKFSAEFEQTFGITRDK